MFKAEQVTWIGEPNEEVKKYHKKWGRWPQWMTWEYKASFEDKKTGKMIPCDLPFLMDEQSHDVFMAEVELLNMINVLHLTPQQKRSLITKIEKYGDTREHKGREDVHEDWAESDAGASL